VVIILALVAIWGIGASVKAASLFTLIEISGLLLVIYVGAPYVSLNPDQLPQSVPPLDAAMANSIVLGAFLAFYAFIGFEDMVNIAQEVEDPARTMPKAIIISLITVTILYTAIAWVALSVVPAEMLSSTDAPLAMVYEKATGGKATVLSIIGMFAVINGVLIQIIMVSRILYGMSVEGWMPSFLSRVNAKTSTPVNATLVTALIVFLLALFLPLLTLAQSTSFVIFIVFTLVNLSLIRIKRRNPSSVEGIKTYPLWIPVTAVILNLLMLAFQTVSLL